MARELVSAVHPSGGYQSWYYFLAAEHYEKYGMADLAKKMRSMGDSVLEWELRKSLKEKAG